MDRGQEIELAANAEVDKLCGLEGFDKTDLINMFTSGATWADEHPKNLWISARDKLPDDEDLVITGCWCTDYFKYLQQGWYCRECNEWHNTDGDEICVTHWMPIPELNVEPKSEQ
jgi:hypothetical protein